LGGLREAARLAEPRGSVTPFRKITPARVAGDGSNSIPPADGTAAAPHFHVIDQLRPRILIIDDEPAIGELLRRFFESTGDYLVDCQTDPRVAMTQAHDFKPDVLILDVNMPEVNGLEVAKALRSKPWLRHRPIIFYTGMPETKLDCYRAGKDGPTIFVTKGTALQELQRSVEKLIASRLHLFRAFRSAPVPRPYRPLSTVARISERK
jgi:CheY-like chemotaxis protein